MLKFYRSMTLLNTMDRILYESQRQVRGLGLGRGLPEVSLPVFEPEGSSQGGWGGGWKSFVLGSSEFLGFS